MKPHRWMGVALGLVLLVGPVASDEAVADTVPAPEFEAVTELPATPAGSRLVDLAVGDAGFVALIETPSRWVLWRSVDGFTWEKSKLPKTRFADASLRAVAAVDGATYVAGARDGYIPTAWAKAGDGLWEELALPRTGAWGWVDEIVGCGDRVVFVGHDSASNHPDYVVWGFTRTGELRASGLADFMPGGDPPPAVFCRGRRFGAFVAGTEPVDTGLATFNDVWLSTTGASWRLKAEDVLDPALELSHLARAAHRLVIASYLGDLAGSHGGLTWQAIDPAAAQIGAEDVLVAMGGGDLGLVVLGHVGWDDPIDPVMWWTPDAKTWVRIDDPPVADGWSTAIAVSGDAVVLAPDDGFAAGAPVLHVARG